MTRPVHILLLLVLFAFPAGAQVLINEVCPRNGTVLEDEDDDAPDWSSELLQRPA